jgi:hypothetical protein
MRFYNKKKVNREYNKTNSDRISSWDKDVQRLTFIFYTYAKIGIRSQDIPLHTFTLEKQQYVISKLKAIGYIITNIIPNIKCTIYWDTVETDLSSVDTNNTYYTIQATELPPISAPSAPVDNS